MSILIITVFSSMEKMGYRYAGELKDCGYKFHRWYTLVYMDKQIGVTQENMVPVRDFAAVREKFGYSFQSFSCALQSVLQRTEETITPGVLGISIQEVYKRVLI